LLHPICLPSRLGGKKIESLQPKSFTAKNAKDAKMVRFQGHAARARTDTASGHGATRLTVATTT
jgi:hypothetical protein